MSDHELVAAKTTSLALVAGTAAAQIAVGVVAGAGVLVSAIGLLTIGAGSAAESVLYAGGLGAGLLSLLAIGVAAGASSHDAGEAQVGDERLVRQVEIHANRLESVASSLSEKTGWDSEDLRREIANAEQAYGLAVEVGAVEHAQRLSDTLAYVRARTRTSTAPAPPPPARRPRRYSI